MIGEQAAFEPQEAAMRWSGADRVKLIASSAVGVGEVGHGIILEGWLPEFRWDDPDSSALSFVLGGRSSVEWIRGGRTCRFVAAPGGFTIAPPGQEDRFRLDRPLRSLILTFGMARLRDLAEEEELLEGETLEILPAAQQRMPELVGLGQAFAGLLRAPRRGSRLYAETLWTQMALQILWNYSTLPRPGSTPVERLSDARLRRVVDFLESSLSEEISLANLADLAGLSPNYFLACFKRATGQTPHRFLTERRVARACELLHNPQLPIAMVALLVGYSSQSHLTTVFRRHMKTTPATYRSRILGGRPGEPAGDGGPPDRP
ncbi:helix-turn-helix domain-containing protein [Tautonia sociabilis]|nr:AraC family transcriptional regulator [Tautonia sociabilis]